MFIVNHVRSSSSLLDIIDWWRPNVGMFLSDSWDMHLDTSGMGGHYHYDDTAHIQAPATLDMAGKVSTNQICLMSHVTNLFKSAPWLEHVSLSNIPNAYAANLMIVMCILLRNASSSIDAPFYKYTFIFDHVYVVAAIAAPIFLRSRNFLLMPSSSSKTIIVRITCQSLSDENHKSFAKPPHPRLRSSNMFWWTGWKLKASRTTTGKLTDKRELQLDDHMSSVTGHIMLWHHMIMLFNELKWHFLNSGTSDRWSLITDRHRRQNGTVPIAYHRLQHYHRHNQTIRRW